MTDYGALAATALENDPATLRRSVNLAAVLQADGVQLEPNGSGRLVGRCPFHADTAPSFAVWRWPDGSWACGCWSCGFSRGDVLDYLQARHGVGFHQAIQLAIQLRDSGQLAAVIITEGSGVPSRPPDFDGVLNTCREQGHGVDRSTPCRPGR